MVTRSASEAVIVVTAMLCVAGVIMIGWQAMQVRRELEAINQQLESTKLKLDAIEDLAESYGYQLCQ